MGIALGLLVWAVPAVAGGDAPPDGLAAAEARGRVPIEVVPAVDAPPVVIRGGTVLTAAGAHLSPGYVVLKGGRIDAVGAGAPPDVAGAVVVDATGRFVTPGLIDTHSHLGVYASPGSTATDDGNEATDPTTPGVWAEHSVWPEDPGFQRALAGGVTTMQILPGSANLIGGQGFVVHNVPTRGSRAMAFPGAPETVKLACGENPKRVYGEQHRAPSTRMGNLRADREVFFAAQEYARDWKEYDDKKSAWDAAKADPKHHKKGPGDEPRPPKRDLDMETLVDLMQGRALAEIHCYRSDDMLAMLQVADEMGFTVRSFHHALEAYKIRDILAARGVAVSTWADWWGFKLEAYDGIPENLALVDEAGGRAIVHTDSPIGIQRMNQEAAKGMASGIAAGIAVDEDRAIKWITINPAWALGIDAQVGSLEAGKRADVVVWSGDPFSVYTRADLVFVDGALRWDAARPQTWSDFELGREVQP
jgi:imidazolonepropionase-like amidohydrolase